MLKFKTLAIQIVLIIHNTIKYLLHRYNKYFDKKYPNGNLMEQ